MNNQQFILYDGRVGNGLGTESAIVLYTCKTLAEAKYNARTGRCSIVACYSYDIFENKLINEKFEFEHFQ